MNLPKINHIRPSEKIAKNRLLNCADCDKMFNIKKTELQEYP